VLSKAHDSQAKDFLRGDVEVDGDAISHEVMIVNGKSRVYFGPVPISCRTAFAIVDIRWTRSSNFSTVGVLE
jgi:hypothetical protein